MPWIVITDEVGYVDAFGVETLLNLGEFCYDWIGGTAVLHVGIEHVTEKDYFLKVRTVGRNASKQFLNQNIIERIGAAEMQI